MIVRNDCVRENTITIELDGYCSSIGDIMAQTPVIDCDNILVCIGPYFVNIEELISEVYTFIQDSNNSNLNNFHLLYSQYQNLYNFFMKCCIDLNNKLTNIQNRLDKMVIVKEIVLKEPSFCYPKSNKPKFIAPLPKQQIVRQETYIIDQTLRSGYIDSVKYDNGLYITINSYVIWLISGVKRKLIPVNVPYKIGTPEANGFIQAIRDVFSSFNLILDINDINYNRIR